MSTIEYNDLFFKCQNTGKYHVFIFDIKDSKTIENRHEVQYQIIELIQNVYKRIQKQEEIEQRRILVFENDFVSLGEKTNGPGLKQEPFILGDAVGLTTYRDSISVEEVLKIFWEEKDNIGINIEFHIADGYYETNDYVEGNQKYFRGYCIDLLMNLHKEKNKNIRTKILKK